MTMQAEKRGEGPSLVLGEECEHTTVPAAARCTELLA